MLPADPVLPALVAAHERGVQAVLAECGVRASVRSVRVLRHHPGSRCVLEVQTGDGRLAIKAFRRDPADRAATLTRLAAAGLAQPRGPSVTVLAGYDGRLACLVLEWLAGEPAVELLAGGRGARVGALAAQWLAAAATVGPGGLDSYGAVPMLSDLARWCEAITNADPTLGERAVALINRLQDDPPPRGRPGLLHGSFSVNHLLELGDGPGVLDWDEPRHGPVELDAGAFLASLRRYAGQQPARSAGAVEVEVEVEAADALVTGAGDVLDPLALAWYRRAALVKHAKHACKLHAAGWRRLADELLRTAGRAWP